MRLVGGVVEDVDSVLMRRSNVCVFGLVWFWWRYMYSAEDGMQDETCC
jgi:hypothetical protein